ncbi:MAG TPA: helix-turn-helix domain-containing protein [Sphingobium sp.]|nr:helix-turn-helix domain-containing protein [Sphingobium sp.]
MAPAARLVRRADRWDEVNQLLGLIQEATSTLKALLGDGIADAGDHGRPTPLSEPHGKPVSVLDEAFALPTDKALSALLERKMAVSGKAAALPPIWDEIVRLRIRERFPSLGQVGAGVLLRLLMSAGEFVSQDELAHAAGVKSGSRRVIKVYICRLRNGFADHNLPFDLIQTGRRSYGLRAEGLPDLLRLLDHG